MHPMAEKNRVFSVELLVESTVAIRRFHALSGKGVLSVIAILRQSMWMLFRQTLNPVASDGRNIVGEQQPALVEPFADCRTDVTAHPSSRILTPAPPNVADDSLIGLLKFLLLILEDSVDAALR